MGGEAQEARCGGAHQGELQGLAQAPQAARAVLAVPPVVRVLQPVPLPRLPQRRVQAQRGLPHPPPRLPSFSLSSSGRKFPELSPTSLGASGASIDMICKTKS